MLNINCNCLVYFQKFADFILYRIPPLALPPAQSWLLVATVGRLSIFRISPRYFLQMFQEVQICHAHLLV